MYAIYEPLSELQYTREYYISDIHITQSYVSHEPLIT